MLVLEQEDQELYDRVQEKNLIRQYDLLTNCIEIGLQSDHTAFDKYMIWALNHVAVAHISQFGGRFREEPIYAGKHIPPHFKEVPELMNRFISFVHENWYIYSPTELAAYALWRMNWIHPFIEGNGRTHVPWPTTFSVCVMGALLGGSKKMPERIKEDRDGYEATLEAADQAWDQGQLDFQNGRLPRGNCCRSAFRRRRGKSWPRSLVGLI
jgi:fido (protein-threonine AMPylation protein)